MSRKIVLDTETTGLEVDRGHRVIEIGCVEVVDRRLTGNTLHHYFNPGREVEAGALAVHGITDAFLAGKPRFAELAREVVDFIDGAELLIHNAAFDVGFLDMELREAGADYGSVRDHAKVTDTLALAREKYPGQRNTLDALCKRLNVDNSGRSMHGALLDAQLLAEVWLAMTAGQGALLLGAGEPERRSAAAAGPVPAAPLQRTRVQRASAAEQAAHLARLDALDKACGGTSLWRRSTG